MMTNLLEVENVYAGYIQDLNILQGINFRIEPGELVTVIGLKWDQQIHRMIYRIIFLLKVM